MKTVAEFEPFQESGWGLSRAWREGERERESAMADPRRCQWLRGEDVKVAEGAGPVLYWMHRDKRAEGNWALLEAQRLALEAGAALAVVVLVPPRYMFWGLRHYHFMLRGLKEVGTALRAKNVPLQVNISSDPAADLCKLARDVRARAVVTDFLPLRDKLDWDRRAAKELEVPMVRVDAHNIVPCWEASDKQEYAARTIRRKVMGKLDEFLVPFPELAAMSSNNFKDAAGVEATTEDGMEDLLQRLQSDEFGVDCKVGVVDEHFPPGPAAAKEQLNKFLDPKRLGRYDTHRNNPLMSFALSHMSPYYNMGQISTQQVILDVKKYAGQNAKIGSKPLASYVEEAVVRRELSDNFCFYNPNYDNLDGASGWAKETLEEHASDPRDHVYSAKQLAEASTQDELWNAAQRQLRSEGKMHGFLRMYWAKKVLEWTSSPKEALETAQMLNDRYALDGNDPNGYVGVAWSVMGIHDQGFKERPVFGKIRYMNYAGCKRKFDVARFEDMYPADKGATPFTKAASSKKRASKDGSSPDSSPDSKKKRKTTKKNKSKSS